MTAQRTVTTEQYRAMRGVSPAASPARVQRQRADHTLGRLEADTMNKTEARYAEHLELCRRAGEIRAFAFEAVNLRLAKWTFYRPDFLVWMADGSIEFREVKGHWEEDAKVKVKVAAKLYQCFRFVIVKAHNNRSGSGWEVKDVRDGL